MPRCSLPPHLDEPSEWKNTDDDQVWWMRWRLYCKSWFAFSHRCPPGLTWSLVLFPGLYLLPSLIYFTGWSWLYLFPVIVIPVAKKWREFPIVLFAFSGGGPLRWETTDGNKQSVGESQNLIWITSAHNPDGDQVWLSRCQLWCLWHVQLQWPLFFAISIYIKHEDVIPTGTKADRDGKLLFFYKGWHRDSDQIFWGDGAYAGRNWK